MYGSISFSYPADDTADFLCIFHTTTHTWESQFFTRTNILPFLSSCPYTFYLVELSRLFHVSTDYLLGTDTSNTLDVSGITEREYQLVYELVQYFRSGH